MNATPEEMERYLRVDPETEYFQAPIPSAHDEEIARICRGLNTPDDYESARRRLAHLGETLLVLFAERMAVLAVRKREEEWLLLGLRASALASKIDDIRIVLAELSLLWHSAGLIGLSPESPFGRVAREAGAFGEVLTGFAGREPELQSISEMLYSTRGEGENFTYHRDW
ncbi:hypothetical protein E1264_33025 [Actinomadura sp. KC216]|uniref:hypothetical protein n=1 Tax=Actinomadura sp. KC216 TaxID=2530370 RepID=UPI0010475AD1|nr:hypothetical protein [Actinomadura sp. KC216]TDB81222.1 hypothetical protein E1264_33025 [Actinomadura sp. KC216]